MFYSCNSESFLKTCEEKSLLTPHGVFFFFFFLFVLSFLVFSWALIIKEDGF